MAKTLELEFGTQMGKVSRISINDPIEPVDPVAVELAMNTILTQNIFQSNSGDFVSILGARLVERNVTDYEFGA
ncbi:MAG TPA: DUF2922 domain-containing protein [Bacillus sp. (in: firmicutes)]|uniref:DUF2922 domain-containing protein n=1 Tax=Bacillus litorisediminis TaxID=2922713 RepID=UPI001FADAA7F|nr:DUF2922 domain-containing protein [Bacillus litorisediminis]HWO77384.1 DUF2922 domain-containing protein [Bacillus sp. (in: firmicutes)]